MKNIKSLLLLSLFLVLFSATGCHKKARTARVEPAQGRPIAASSGNRPVFVTETPARPAEKDPEPEPATEVRAAAAEAIAPVYFTEKESEHVRIVDYNPFGNGSDLTIDLDELSAHFCYPYPGNKISDYGMRGRATHTGIDIKAAPNDTVRAALSGVVRMSKLYSSYGNIVVIRHPCGLETAYAHNSKNLVRPNDLVQAGDPIALAGRTGRATTEHIHFEARVMGEHFDPNLILDCQSRTLRGGKLYLRRQNGRIWASDSSGSSRAAEPPAVTAASASASRPVVATTSPTSSAAGDVHTVRRGDTLYSISRKYGLTIDQLCALNGISRDGVLSIDQKIKVK